MRPDLFICTICFHVETCPRILGIARTAYTVAAKHVCTNNNTWFIERMRR